MTRLQQYLWLILIACSLASIVRAPFPKQLLLQNSPTLFVIIALPLVSRRWSLSNVTFGCIVAFMLLHVLGARYIYSYVPYDKWLRPVLGFTLTERFGFERNHYDRFVHFFFGVLWLRPVWEVATRHFRVPPRFGYYAAVEFVLAFSLLYELFEWGITMVLSPHDAGAYNGEQGDRWDAHKDMSLAFLGALLTLATWRGISRLRARRSAG